MGFVSHSSGAGACRFVVVFFIEEKFPASKFVRVHRSYIINLDKIDAIDESDLIIYNHPIPIGKTYRENLMKRLSFL